MTREKYPWIYDVLFLLVFALAGYLRLTGVDWGEGQHQHPDENTFTSVLYLMQAQKCADPDRPAIACRPEQKRWLSLADYFNSKTSTLNPYNIGFGSFVYGDLPMVMIRVAADLTNQINPRFFGRQVSAFADLFAILLLYLVVSNLYNRRVALLSALFSALAVMQIQQSHFFTIDLFVNLFSMLPIYFAVKIFDARLEDSSSQEEIETSTSEIEEQELSEVPKDQFSSSHESEGPSAPTNSVLRLLRHPLFLLSIGFGVAYGMALSSKLNIYPLAILLPGAFAVRYFMVDRKLQTEEAVVDRPSFMGSNYWTFILICLVAGGFASIVSFRVFQPYAFDGLTLDPRWVADITQQRAQATGEADMPWNLQWARRTHFYSFTNLTVWGLGLPLGILAWAGFLLMGWRVFKGEWRHALLWGWTALYFFWQSMQFNPTMRYQLPIYPLLEMMAAWFLFELAGINVRAFKRLNVGILLAGIVGISVVALTAIWAFVFHSIYLRQEPRIAASYWIFKNIPGPINIQVDTDENGVYNQPLPFPAGGYIEEGIPYDTTFFPNKDGIVESISLGHALNTLASTSTLKVSLSVMPNPTSNQALATSTLTADFDSDEDPRGKPYTLKLNRPVSVNAGQPYYLHFELDRGILTIDGSAVSNETDYDYPLPFNVDGFDAFGGIYRGDLTLQVYWGDTPDQRDRYLDILDQTDYILIPTNHQYAQITRVPERYPMTTLYYRELIGCPPGEDIIECYRTAKPGDYQGRLGFDLVAVFENYPTLGSLVINDQSAEEAFTFYDHPKVFIFKKNKDFEISQVRATLNTVDLTKVVHLTPRQFNDYSNLMLSETTLAKQRAGGTWSQLFDYDWIQNRYPVLGLVIWYVFIFILGLAVYPLLRLALPGLADKGYPLSRALGLVLFGYLAWIGGSNGISYTRTNIAVLLGLILLLGAALAYYQREELRDEWRVKRRYFLMIEGLFLAFFLFDLIIRLANPDLWHHAKGGERPMDFSYFNAILKSTSFPPYDPWFAGGYINYYYYGFVLVGTPVKLLGIVPSIAYNFILPTLFAIVGICAFSIGWNLLARDKGEGSENESSPLTFDPSPLISGLAASAFTLFLGNLGTIQLIFQQFQQIGAGPAFTWEATTGIFQRWAWAIQGFVLVAKGAPLGIGLGDWYWFPSRVVPPLGGNEITEFPLFTFIYSDLHAHMIAMPLALLALSWALAIVAGRSKWRNPLAAALGFAAGGLIIGALYPSNLSDMYTYLPIGLAALGYGIWRYSQTPSLVRRFGLGVVAVLALTILSFVLYQPYRDSYSQVYSALDIWKGPHTPLGSYLTHWMVLLFVVVSWMVWETREWMAETPISALAKLKPYQILIEAFLVVIAFLLLGFQYLGTSVAWIALPIATWAGILLLRPNMSDAKRFVLFLIGTALVITIVVEVIVVRGDIGRQNTIFKFYLQSWFLLAVSAGAAFAWTLPAYFKWLPGWRLFWQTAMILLISGAAMFTISGSMGKMRDRWIVEAPRTLDSITFMKYAHYDDFGERMDLSEDYRAIRWMQDHVQGSPVLVEASCIEYHWCKRFITYTGLPGVVGWNWHQRQQRGLMSTWVEDRVTQTDNFYNSLSTTFARKFLRTFDVKYIIVGQLERAEYTPEGIAKFETYEGKYWREVYRDGDTVIYEVIS
jgi:YYY domain-containing protein